MAHSTAAAPPTAPADDTTAPTVSASASANAACLRARLGLATDARLRRRLADLMQPVWDGAQFVPRLMLPLSLSYDHRVIDGALAARFTAHLVGVLSDLRRALL